MGMRKIRPGCHMCVYVYVCKLCLCWSEWKVNEQKGVYPLPEMLAAVVFFFFFWWYKIVWLLISVEMLLKRNRKRMIEKDAVFKIERKSKRDGETERATAQCHFGLNVSSGIPSHTHTHRMIWLNWAYDQMIKFNTKFEHQQQSSAAKKLRQNSKRDARYEQIHIQRYNVRANKQRVFLERMKQIVKVECRVAEVKSIPTCC